MTDLQRSFEHWATINRWSDLLSLTKQPDGTYDNLVTHIAFEAYVASQAHVIDMITKQDYAEGKAA